MSIWTRPLFGKAKPSTPASPVSVRCARIRLAGSLDEFAPYMLGLGAGYGLASAVIVIVLNSASPAAGRPPLASTILEFVMAQSPQEWAVLVGLVALVILAVPRFARWNFDRGSHEISREQVSRMRRSRHVEWRIHIVVAGCLVLMILLFAVGTTWQVAAIMGSGLSFIAGVPMVTLGLRGRRGARLVCGRCDYPMVTWRGASERCPECGNEWRKPWRARFGARTIRGRLVGAGAGLIALAAVLSAAVAITGI